MNTYKKSRRLSCARCRRSFRTPNGLDTHACKGGGGDRWPAWAKGHKIHTPSRKAKTLKERFPKAKSYLERKSASSRASGENWAYWYVDHPTNENISWSEHAFGPADALFRAKKEWAEEMRREGLSEKEISRLLKDLHVTGRKSAYRPRPR